MFELIQVKFLPIFRSVDDFQLRFIQPLHRPAIEWISPRWWPFLLLKFNLGPSMWQCQRQLYTGGNYSVPNNQHVESCPVESRHGTGHKQKIFSLKHNLKQAQAMCEMQLKDDQKRKYPVLPSFMLRILSIKFVVKNKLENNLTTFNL